MSVFDDESYEVIDTSRPNVTRKPEEMILYMDVDEAETVDSHAYGSKQMMRIELLDLMSEQFTKVNLLKLKTELDNQGTFHDVVLEEFRGGSNLAVTFNTKVSVEELWALHKQKKLSGLFQGILVDKALIQKLKVKSMVMRIRLFKDERDTCLKAIEKMVEENSRVNIHTRPPRDAALLKQMRDNQRKLQTKLQLLHEAEGNLDRNLKEFTVSVRQYLPETATGIPCLQDFHDSMQSALKSYPRDTTQIKNFFDTLDLLRSVVKQVKEEYYIPMTMIPGRCETVKQRDVKANMRALLGEVQTLLSPSNKLPTIGLKDWERRISRTDRQMFLGLVCLIPTCVEKLTESDRLLDEYITSFPNP